MSHKLPREAIQRLAETAAQYRESFLLVQDQLERTDLGRIPAWVFAIDRLPLEEVREMSTPLADAEERRRGWRTALHALVEHLALDAGEETTPDPTAPDEAALETAGDRAHLRKLDRFITVVNFAKAGGCIYLDGGFQPVGGRGAGPEEDEGTTRAAPRPASPEPDADALTRGLPKG